MCANFEPISIKQAHLFTSHPLDFDYSDDIYPNHLTPLLFAAPGDDQMQWRCVHFGMVPKWADNTDITRYTYNARSETVHQKPSFKNAWYNNQFALIPVNTLYEPKYINGKAERWGISRIDDEPFTVAALYEIARVGGEIVRSMSMLTINADHHPFMSQFHRPEAEKRSVVVIPLEMRMDWLQGHHNKALQFLQPMSDSFKANQKPRAARLPVANTVDPKQGQLF
ncbi:SOS response-associated peptidase family protein [Psychrobacter sp. FDAARGOS_221]|uniref:SOS response-associated peptidase family protein n=1 Tax=Psychrobacter sp. FDAARGOS_221 TaxID=1975705 RepID=UPI000BB55817|nr:SOS response-associated peptidase family protein [Psychrobacter sp. FDAARGOS_221]PNK61532.1 DUF159 family protein [Psychrobacter sp. FDAARGOS_221]